MVGLLQSRTLPRSWVRPREIGANPPQASRLEAPSLVLSKVQLVQQHHRCLANLNPSIPCLGAGSQHRELSVSRPAVSHISAASAVSGLLRPTDWLLSGGGTEGGLGRGGRPRGSARGGEGGFGLLDVLLLESRESLLVLGRRRRPREWARERRRRQCVASSFSFFNSSNCFILHRFHSFKQLIRWGRLFLPATGARSSR